MRVGLDIDDVIAQLLPTWLDDYNRGTGDSVPLSAVTVWELDRVVTHGKRIYDFLTSEMYDRVQPYPDALPAVERLRAMGHTVHYVSNCGADNQFANAKWMWLGRHGFLLPGDTWIENPRPQDGTSCFIPGPDKTHAPVDVLLDDHVKNVEAFKGPAALLTRHHNLSATTWRPRVRSISHFVDMVGQLDRYRQFASTASL